MYMLLLNYSTNQLKVQMLKFQKKKMTLTSILGIKTSYVKFIAELAILLKILSSKRRKTILLLIFFVERFQKYASEHNLGNLFTTQRRGSLWILHPTKYCAKDTIISDMVRFFQRLLKNKITPRFAKRDWI